MAKHFTQSEKSAIQTELMAKGKDLFSRYGLKKTTINDFTSAVGIAKGTFYHFFDSKEILYFEIFLREERRLKKQSLEFLSSFDQITPKQFQKFLFESINLVDKNPILQVLLNKDEYEQLMRKLPPGYLEEHTREDTEVLTPLFSQMQQQGNLIQWDIHTIVGVIRAMMMLTLHKSELGEDSFEDIMKLLTKLIAKGLIKERANEHG